MSTDWLSVYRGSLYALPLDGGGETCFALDGPVAQAAEGAAVLELRGAASWITAWNPDSVEQDAAWNVAASQRLEAALREAGVEFRPSYGSSLPGTRPAWREEGYTLSGLNRAAAAEWGAAWGQRALVQIDAAGAGLLFCADRSFHPCGVRLLSDRAPGPAPMPDAEPGAEPGAEPDAEPAAKPAPTSSSTPGRADG